MNRNIKNKDNATNTSSRACRCTPKSNTSTSSKSTISTNTSASLLQNPKVLPVREFEKLSPIPLSNHSSNTKNGNDSDKDQHKSTEHTSAANHKAISTDDSLILRISDTRASSSSVTNANQAQSGDKTALKIKARTKTDPQPISSPQKQRHLSPTSSGTSTINLNHKCSPRANGQHNSGKCNCSSCNVNGKQSNASSTSCAGEGVHKRKSVGTQHDAFDPWIKQSATIDNPKRSQSKSNSSAAAIVAAGIAANQKSANSNAKVIVITDDFKKKALNQEVVVDTKRKILRYMRANKILNSSLSMDDVRLSTDDTNAGPKLATTNENVNEHQMNSSVLSVDKSETNQTPVVDKKKTISKSVDNISVLSADLDALDNVGSVELIFISDEFLNKVSDQNVIVLKNNEKMRNTKTQTNGSKMVNGTKEADHSDANGGNVTRGGKEIVVVSEDFRRKSIQDQQIVIVDEPKRNGTTNGVAGGKQRNPKLQRKGSGESSVDDVNNKIKSRAFQSYDEEQEHLESKEIQSPTAEEIIL